jgi:hypothetical protein
VGAAAFSKKVVSDEKARAGIEKLHQQDRDATLSDKADELKKLWDPEAVRIQAGSPAEVGRNVIYEDATRNQRASVRFLCQRHYDFGCAAKGGVFRSLP